MRVTPLWGRVTTVAHFDDFRRWRFCVILLVERPPDYENETQTAQNDAEDDGDDGSGGLTRGDALVG
jgi:hypothetical protein